MLLDLLSALVEVGLDGLHQLVEGGPVGGLNLGKEKYFEDLISISYKNDLLLLSQDLGYQIITRESWDWL